MINVYCERTTSMKPADVLRSIADGLDLEADRPLSVHRINFLEPVTRTETGDAVVDYNDRGFLAIVTNMQFPSTVVQEVEALIRTRMRIKG